VQGRFDALAGVEEGDRNNRLFHQALREALHCDDLIALLDALATVNAGLQKPLSDAEVEKTARSAWRYQSESRNWVGSEARAVSTKTDLAKFCGVQNGGDAHLLHAMLHVAHATRGEPFAVSPDAMSASKTIGDWSPQRIRKARKVLLDLGFLTKVHHGGNGLHDPSLFRLSQ
jgi:hypothetical protein